MGQKINRRSALSRVSFQPTLTITFCFGATCRLRYWHQTMQRRICAALKDSVGVSATRSYCGPSQRPLRALRRWKVRAKIPPPGNICDCGTPSPRHARICLGTNDNSQNDNHAKIPRNICDVIRILSRLRIFIRQFAVLSRALRSWRRNSP